MLTRRILGIDPGSRITGFGLIQSSSPQKAPTCIMSGCWRLKQDDMSARLSELYFSVRNFIEEYQPTEIAIERVFVSKNALSALKLGQARGVAMAAAVADHLPLYEYAATQIKKAVVGTGRGDKEQVQHMVRFLLRLSKAPQADEADALGVAICHLHSHNPSLQLFKEQGIK